MPNTRSRLEQHLVQFLAATPLPAARPALRTPRIDLVYLSDAGRDSLDEIGGRE